VRDDPGPGLPGSTNLNTAGLSHGLPAQTPPNDGDSKEGRHPVCLHDVALTSQRRVPPQPSIAQRAVFSLALFYAVLPLNFAIASSIHRRTRSQDARRQ